MSEAMLHPSVVTVRDQRSDPEWDPFAVDFEDAEKQERFERFRDVLGLPLGDLHTLARILDDNSTDAIRSRSDEQLIDEIRNPTFDVEFDEDGTPTHARIVLRTPRPRAEDVSSPIRTFLRSFSRTSGRAPRSRRTRTRGGSRRGDPSRRSSGSDDDPHPRPLETPRGHMAAWLLGERA